MMHLHQHLPRLHVPDFAGFVGGGRQELGVVRTEADAVYTTLVRLRLAEMADLQTHNVKHSVSVFPIDDGLFKATTYRKKPFVCLILIVVTRDIN